MEAKIITDIVEKLKGFEIVKFCFVEDGYEIYLMGEDSDTINRLTDIEVEGLIIADCTKDKSYYRLLLVPESIEKMTEYIWDYVEKYCDKYVPQEKTCYNLNLLEDMADLCNAFSALETAIEQISEDKRATALKNYSEFSKMLF